MPVLWTDLLGLKRRFDWLSRNREFWPRGARNAPRSGPIWSKTASLKIVCSQTVAPSMVKIWESGVRSAVYGPNFCQIFGKLPRFLAIFLRWRLGTILAKWLWTVGPPAELARLAVLEGRSRLVSCHKVPGPTPNRFSPVWGLPPILDGISKRDLTPFRQIFNKNRPIKKKSHKSFQSNFFSNIF